MPTGLSLPKGETRLAPVVRVDGTKVSRSKKLARVKRTRKPRQRRRPKLVKQNLQDFGLVDFGGVVCRPDCPAWWRGEDESAVGTMRNGDGEKTV